MTVSFGGLPFGPPPEQLVQSVGLGLGQFDTDHVGVLQREGYLWLEDRAGALLDPDFL
jgi:hypothetical protein